MFYIQKRIKEMSSKFKFIIEYNEYINDIETNNHLDQYIYTYGNIPPEYLNIIYTE